MNLPRIIIPIITFVVAIAVVCAAAFLPWIPEWYIFQTITGSLGILAGLLAAILLLRGVWLQTRASMRLGFRITLAVATGVLVTAMLTFGSLLTILSANGGFMGPTLFRKFEFPEYSTTVYLYDAGFFDSQALFRMRRNWLPFEWEIGSFPEWDTYHLEFEQQGEWAICEKLRIHLPTGEVEIDPS